MTTPLRFCSDEFELTIFNVNSDFTVKKVVWEKCFQPSKLCGDFAEKEFKEIVANC